jgi:hypothetical protein
MFSLPAGLLFIIPSCAGGIEASVVGRAVDVIAPVVVSPSQYLWVVKKRTKRYKLTNLPAKETTDRGPHSNSESGLRLKMFDSSQVPRQLKP